MNIFILSENPILAAQYQVDKHVIKMVLEATQILSTVVGGPYKPTHANHPCVVWARTNETNFFWLKRHARALCAEYTHRYHKRHKCQDVIEHLPPPHLPVGITPFVQCMPPEFRDPDPVQAYRKYYRGAKASFAHWTNRSIPFWWNHD